ncbi:MAG: hypothetical protein LBU86_03235 [Oscillospiraceae bacterium]|jgi:DNA repair protein RadC|nr:hypothetical protein [Oscillospiraceae bacterium]
MSSHSGHRDRVKKEFRDSGLDHFPDHKVLEMLLYYAIPRADTNETGHALISRFGSLSGVFDAPLSMLKETVGVGLEAATYIKYISGVIRRYMDDYTSLHNIINDPESAKDYMRHKFLCESRECAYVACMANNGRVIFCDRVGEGTGVQVSIIPAEIVRLALRCDAVRAVLAHNHPGGICNPSSHDLRTTSIVFDELRRVGIELIDHIIVAPDGVYSMVENSMFPAFRG